MANYRPDPALDPYEAENAFYLQSHPTRIAKLLAHYELYRKIVHLPGAVIEAGVYKGASLMRFAAFRATLENDHSRPLIGFDAFGSFPRSDVSGEEDRDFIDKFENAGGPGISKDALTALFAKKGYANLELHEGDIFDTLPAYLRQNPAAKVAFLHLDLDVYEPTAFALQTLVPHMVRGGLIVLDDYGLVKGATVAADALCADLNLEIRKLTNYEIPAYIVMP